MSIKIKFIISLTLFSALIFILGCLTFSLLLKNYFLPVFYLFVFYFMILTLAGRLVLFNTNLDNPGNFNIRYFTVRWIKVLLHFIFIVAYLINNRDNILAFILTFLACYLLYSLYDIYTLSFYLKKSK